MKFPRQHSHLALFSFSSLTDIVFLLLIFFLLSSSFVIQPGIRVQLPKAEAVEEERQRHIVITVTQAGELFLNDEVVTVETLGSRLESMIRSRGDQLVVIKADQRVSLQSAVQVMDIAKGVGVSRLLIATQPPQ
jgi:biopolymer transport protein ExbD